MTSSRFTCRPSTIGGWFVFAFAMFASLGCWTEVEYAPAGGTTASNGADSGAPPTGAEGLSQAPAFVPEQLTPEVSKTAVGDTATVSNDGGNNGWKESPATSQPPAEFAAEFAATKPPSPASNSSGSGAPSTSDNSDRYAAASKPTTDELPPELAEDPLWNGLFGDDKKPSEKLAAEPPANDPPTEQTPTESTAASEQPENDFFGFGSDPAESLAAANEETLAPPLEKTSPTETPTAESTFDFDKPPAEPMEEPLPEPKVDPPTAKPAAKNDQPADSPIPLDANNTPHLAWLLGTKMSAVALAAIAQDETAADDAWQITAIAQMLGISPPEIELKDASAADQAILGLLKQSRTTAVELAEAQGRDHAALLEIALKTNALLLAYDIRPELTGPVRRAVETAAKRAELPTDIIKPFVNQLAKKSTAKEIRQAVFELHDQVERKLRTAK